MGQCIVFEQPDQHPAIAPQRRHIAVDHRAAAQRSAEVTVRLLHTDRAVDHAIEHRVALAAVRRERRERADVAP